LPKEIRKKSLPWPVNGKVIAKFGKNKHPELDTYVISNGIKIDAADFSRVKSVDSGTVVFTGEFRSYGKVVIIDHKDSIFSVYGLLDHILVKEDQKVLKEDVIADLGGGKNSYLYFEIRQNNIPDDPILWLQQK
jgi:septal ring factor EnvC (AmiA/AmiB activator)